MSSLLDEHRAEARAARRLRRVVLDRETDFEGFREAARRLWAAQADPADASWSVRGSDAEGLAFDDAPPEPGCAPPRDLRVHPDFVALCREVILHRDAQRFALLYRLLWRQAHDPRLRHDALDPDLRAAQQMAQSVRRDIHKMRAFVRFRPVAEPGHDDPLHVAWFEPQHRIVEANASFFERRFSGMRWAILTPERSARWDGRDLQFGPGADKGDAPEADAGEALWLAYYRSIFNPARLKLRAMEKEMPKSYWRNLPEATLIAPLAAEANRRRERMIEQAPTLPRRRIVPISTNAPTAPDTPGLPAAQGHRVVGAPIPPGDRVAAWTAQRDAASVCRECPLGAFATQTVWGEGPVGARLMLVGEQPGDREDLEGRPFVGPAGKLLTRAMAELGWDRSAVYVGNAVKHFKYELRGKRRMHKTPAQKEADACLHWLESEIELVAPEAIVALGATAARQLLGRPVPVMKARGQWFDRADGRRVLVTLHPSALLRGEPGRLEEDFGAWLDDLRIAGEFAHAAQPAAPLSDAAR